MFQLHPDFAVLFSLCILFGQINIVVVVVVVVVVVLQKK